MEIRTEIEISAPPSRVWAVLKDFDAYSAWNPFLVQISGKPVVGERLTIVIAPPGVRKMTIRPKVRVVNEDSELRWRGQLLVRGLFDGEHFFQLVDLGDGRTRVHHGEDFSGILVRFFPGMLAKTKQGFTLANEALKRRAEGASG